MSTVRITGRDAADMLRHWISTPIEGYLGSGYGNELKLIQQSPMAAGLADGQIAKARQDIPLLAAAPAGSINMYKVETAFDEVQIVFEVAGQVVPIQNNAVDTAVSLKQVPTGEQEVSETVAAVLATNGDYF